MTCSFNKEILLDYLDTGVSGTLKTQIEAHIKTCAECRQELESLKQTDALWTESLAPHALDRDFIVDVKRRISLETTSRQILLRWLPVTAAAALLLAVIGLVVFRSLPDDKQDSPVIVQPNRAGDVTVASKVAPIPAASTPTAVAVQPMATLIGLQTESTHFHILHKKQPMLAVFIRAIKPHRDKLNQNDINVVMRELVKVLYDCDGQVRGVAAAALGELQTTEAIPNLVLALQDTEPLVRGWAAIALVELGAKDKVTKETLDDVRAILNNSQDSFYTRIQTALSELDANNK